MLASLKPVLLRKLPFDYFVDSVRGSDTNAGMRPNAPFATLAAAVAALGSATNKRIGLACGSTWLEQISISNVGITVGSYGSGDKPYIDARDPLSSGGWTLTGGQTVVWQRTVTLPNDASSQGNVWEDEKMLKQVTSIAACAALAGSAFMSSWTGATATLYIQPTTSDDPASNGKAYKYSSRLYCLSLLGDACTVRGIRTRGACYTGGSIALGTNGLIDQCRIEDGGRHSSIAGIGHVVTNSYYYRVKNDLDGVVGNFICVNQPNISAGVYSSSGNTFDAGDTDAAVALLAHDNVAGRQAVSFTSINDTFIGSTMGDCDAVTMTFTNPVLTNAGGGLSCTKPGATVTVTNLQGNISGAGRLLLGSTGGNITFTGGALTVAQVDNGVIWGSSTSADLNVNLTNINIQLSGIGISTFKFVTIARGTLAVNGVTIGPSIACPFLKLFEAGVGATGAITGNNNTLPYGANWVLNGTTYTNLTDWQVASGADANSAYGARTQTFFDDFNRADENLSANANWTLLAGTAPAGQVASNMVKMVNTANGTYGAPLINSADQWAEVIVEVTTSSGKNLALKLTDDQNWCGVAWSATQVFFQRRIANVFGQPGASSVGTTSVGDVVCAAIRGDLGYVYVNKRLKVGPVTAGVTALTAQRAGLVLGGTTANPMLDDFRCGSA